MDYNIDMQSDITPKSPPTLLPAALITTSGGLAHLVNLLSKETIIAVDTESNGLHAYREQVCLIQFSTENADYLVDPLSLPDIAPLGRIFANPEIEKVFHAADYDLVCLKRDFGFRINNLFDTMLAARILGKTTLGLGALLEAEFGVILDKHLQRADWGKRPLTPEMLTYARFDTHYLIALRRELFPQLVDSGRWELAREDFSRLCGIEPNNNHLDETDSLPHIPGAHELTPQQYTVLLELCNYRDHIARSINRPIFKVFNAETLLAIARYCPGNPQELSKLHGMTPRAIERHGKQLLSAVRRGLEKEPQEMPRPQRPNDAYLNRLDRLRKWRKAVGAKWDVDSDIILPKDLMINIAESAPHTLEELQPMMVEAPWRYGQFGSQLLEALWPPPRKSK